MAPRPVEHARMALWKTVHRSGGFSVPHCARCLSIATRSAPDPRQTARRIDSRRRTGSRNPPQRCFTHEFHPTLTSTSGRPSRESLRKLGLVDPCEPVEPGPGQRLPADGKHIAIVGGGLTGLTTAYYMASVVGPSTKITLYEASSRLGGWIRTDQVPVDVGGKKGIVNFERGPRSLSSLIRNKGRFDDLIFYDLCIRLGLQPRTVPTLPRYLYYPDHLVPVPNSIADIIMNFTKEELWRDTLPGAAWGYLKYVMAGKPMQETDLSIAGFLQHICGTRAVADNLVSGMIHGIYGGDVDKLSAYTCLYPMLDNMYNRKDKNKLLASGLDVRVLASFMGDPAVRKMARDVADQKGALLHFGSQGLQALPDALGAALRSQPNVEIKTSMPLRKLEYARADKKMKVTEKTGKVRTFDKVYTTIGAQDLSKLVPGKLHALKELNSVSIMAVNLWFPEPNLKPPGFGYLIPRSVSEELNPHHALGVFFDSDIGNNHPDEPEGTKLFVLMGGHHYEKPGVKIPTPDEAIKQARELLERHLGIPASLPCHAEANFKRDCIPQHEMAHGAVMASMQYDLQDEFEGRLFPTGGSFSRIGGMAAIRDGWLAGTLGLDLSKPIPEDALTNGWEGLVAPMISNDMSRTTITRETIAPVRTASYGEFDKKIDHITTAMCSKTGDSFFWFRLK